MIKEIIFFGKTTKKYYAFIGDSPYPIPATLAKRIIKDLDLVEQIEEDYINYIKKQKGGKK